MYNIPMDAVQVFTNGSKMNYCTGSGMYIKSHKKEVKLQKKNVDFCSVLKCELIAFYEGLDIISSLPPMKEIWFLIDSKNFVQHLTNWHIY